MPSTRLTVRLAAALVGALIAVAVFVVMPDEKAARPESIAAVRSDLERRWERWRRTTAAFTETTVRTSGEQELVADAEIAQRFPDRVVRDGDDISAEVDGRQIGCSVAGMSPPECLDSGPAADAEARLADELAEFRSLTGGSTPAYRLSRTDAGCFRLRHLVEEFRPRWGDRLDLCFDDRTGVLRTEVTTIGPLTISVARRDIRNDVDDAEFSLPAAPA